MPMSEIIYSMLRYGTLRKTRGTVALSTDFSEASHLMRHILR